MTMVYRVLVMRHRIGRWPNVPFGAGRGLASFGYRLAEADIDQSLVRRRFPPATLSRMDHPCSNAARSTNLSRASAQALQPELSLRHDEEFQHSLGSLRYLGSIATKEFKRIRDLLVAECTAIAFERWNPADVELRDLF